MFCGINWIVFNSNSPCITCRVYYRVKASDVSLVLNPSRLVKDPLIYNSFTLY